MSFDLGFWYAVPEGAQPGDVYQRLAEGEVGAALEAAEAIDAFYADVVAVYPDLAVVEDGDEWDEDEDNSPWAAGIDRTAEGVIVSISWSRRDELTPFLRDLARKHRLAMYDPQSQVLVP